MCNTKGIKNIITTSLYDNNYLGRSKKSLCKFHYSRSTVHLGVPRGRGEEVVTVQPSSHHTPHPNLTTPLTPTSLHSSPHHHHTTPPPSPHPPPQPHHTFHSNPPPLPPSTPLSSTQSLSHPIITSTLLQTVRDRSLAEIANHTA